MQPIFIVIVSVLSVLVFLLLIKTNKTPADKYLVAFFVTIILGVANDILVTFFTEHSAWFRFGGITVPLAAAFLFLYVDALISNKKLPLLHQILLFVPSALVLAFLAFGSELGIIKSSNILLITGYYLAKMGLPLLFLILSSIRLSKYRKSLKDGFSYIEQIDFRWLKVLIDSSLVLMGMALAGFIFYRTDVISTLDILIYFTNISLFIFILFLVYYGIKNTRTFRDIITQSNIQIENHSPTSNQTGNTINFNESVNKQLVERLEHTIKSEKPYLSEKLTIAMLAGQTDIPQKQLSQILNTHYKKNFFDYINALRIDEFNRRIEKGDAQQFTILSIAYDCGFSSKSAFNRAYKKHMGVPPSEFAKSGTAA